LLASEATTITKLNLTVPLFKNFHVF